MSGSTECATVRLVGLRHGLPYKVLLNGRDVSLMLVEDPEPLFVIARTVVALLGTLTVALVYVAGRDFFDRRVGLWAAAFVGLGYLPVFYGHFALNDVPTLLPVTAALIACLRVHRSGRVRDLVLAGALVGLAAGVKYLAAPMCLLVALAVVMRLRAGEQTVRSAFVGLVASGVAAIGGLVVLNPFIVPEIAKFWDHFTGQSAQAATTKLGQVGSAWLGYPSTLVWGFGLVPLLLAVVGAVILARRDPDRALLLIAFPIVLYVAMASQGRWFARWLLPAYPMLAVLAGYAAAHGVEALTARRVTSVLATAIVAVVALAQPVIDVVRSDVLLTRADTRTEALEWATEHIPAGSRIVVEPAVPASYRRALDAVGLERREVSRPFQRYEMGLGPSLLEDYRDGGFCWAMVNAHQRDRGLAAGLAGAEAYYGRLDSEAERVFVASPFGADSAGAAFSYDFSFNYYPLAYSRPGPVVEIHRLTDCSTTRGGSS